MTNLGNTKDTARQTSLSPLSSDDYDELDDAYVLVNENTMEVRLVSVV